VNALPTILLVLAGFLVIRFVAVVNSVFTVFVICSLYGKRSLHVWCKIVRQLHLLINFRSMFITARQCSLLCRARCTS